MGKIIESIKRVLMALISSLFGLVSSTTASRLPKQSTLKAQNKPGKRTGQTVRQGKADKAETG
jgi:hypothetical protein